MRTRPPSTQERALLCALVGAGVVWVAVAGLLASPLPRETKELVSGAGFLIGGVALAVSAMVAVRRSVGTRRRRAWVLLGSAAWLALIGNAWSALSGGDPVQDPSPLGQVGVAVALALSVAGLLGLAGEGVRGARLALFVLDGVVTACAVLIIATVTVLPRLAASDGALRDPVTLLFPVLDLAVATVALLLILRSRGDRLFFLGVGIGFLCYAVGDLVFAAQAAEGSFRVGTMQDMLWISGYLLLAAMAWHPAAARASDHGDVGTTLDVQGTVMIFGMLVGAGAVQLLLGAGGPARTLLLLWLSLIVAVGVRQTVLAADNLTLRSGLERTVRDQTANLRRMTRETEVMLRSVGDGIYGVDVRGRITFMNPSGGQALGHDPTDLLGQHAHDLFHTATADASGRAAPCYIDEAIATGSVALAEVDEYVRADGSSFPVEITAAPLVDEDRVLGAVVVFRDVTQRLEVDRMKDEFLSIVSHELRTPLTSIYGSLEMLESGMVGTPDPQTRKMLSIAARSTERLSRLINDILDVERLRSGHLPLDLATHDAAALVHAAARELEGLAESASVRLRVGAVSGVVHADADRVVQTLTNLVGNAVKFSAPGGEVRLGAEVEEGMVHFTVSDDGRGIPVDKLEQVFAPFVQVDASDTRRQGGTGLGLAISRGIVRRHGGDIWAESRLGMGTTMHFTLPAAIASAGPTDAADAQHWVEAV